MDFDAVLDQVVDAPPTAGAGVLSGAEAAICSSMTTRSKISRKNSSMPDSSRWMRRAQCWSGRETRGSASARAIRLPSIRSTSRQSQPGSTPTQLSRVRQTPNAASSRCCSVTWWTRRRSPASSTRKSWREVVRAYQETCAKVIARFEGHIAQYLGDGLLVYFGYPQAHEDDAQRAVRAGLGMVEAMGQLNTRLAQERGVQLAVRLGIHTGSGGRGRDRGRGEAGTVGPRRDAQRRRPPARASRRPIPW